MDDLYGQTLQSMLHKCTSTLYTSPLRAVAYLQRRRCGEDVYHGVGDVLGVHSQLHHTPRVVISPG